MQQGPDKAAKAEEPNKDETAAMGGMMAKRKAKEDELKEALRIQDGINDCENNFEEEKRASADACAKLREDTNTSKNVLTEQIAVLEERKVNLEAEMDKNLTEMGQLCQRKKDKCDGAVNGLKGEVGYRNADSIAGLLQEVAQISKLQSMMQVDEHTPSMKKGEMQAKTEGKVDSI